MQIPSAPATSATTALLKLLLAGPALLVRSDDGDHARTR